MQPFIKQLNDEMSIKFNNETLSYINNYQKDIPLMIYNLISDSHLESNPNLNAENFGQSIINIICIKFNYEIQLYQPQDQNSQFYLIIFKITQKNIIKKVLFINKQKDYYPYVVLNYDNKIYNFSQQQLLEINEPQVELIQELVQLTNQQIQKLRQKINKPGQCEYFQPQKNLDQLQDLDTLQILDQLKQKQGLIVMQLINSGNSKVFKVFYKYIFHIKFYEKGKQEKMIEFKNLQQLKKKKLMGNFMIVQETEFEQLNFQFKKPCMIIQSGFMTLREYISEQFVNQRYQAINIYRRLRKMIGSLHEQGVYHCDIKPENIVISTDFEIKFIDFGSLVFDKVMYGSKGYTEQYSMLAKKQIRLNQIHPSNLASNQFFLLLELYSVLSIIEQIKEIQNLAALKISIFHLNLFQDCTLKIQEIIKQELDIWQQTQIPTHNIFQNPLIVKNLFQMNQYFINFSKERLLQQTVEKFQILETEYNNKE